MNNQIGWRQRLMLKANPNTEQQHPRPQAPARQCFKFFSWQMIELLAVTTAGVVVTYGAMEGQRRLDEQNKTIKDLQDRLSVLEIGDAQSQYNFNTRLTDIEQTHRQALSFLYDKLKEAHKVSFNTMQITGTDPIILPVPNEFAKEDCKFFSVVSQWFRHPGHATEYTRFSTKPSVTTNNSEGLHNPDIDGFKDIFMSNDGLAGVLATKPIISEEEVAKKKKQYKLIT